MNMREQQRKWLEEHPQATAEEAWEAGYFQSTDNWVHKER